MVDPREIVCGDMVRFYPGTTVHKKFHLCLFTRDPHVHWMIFASTFDSDDIREEDWPRTEKDGKLVVPSSWLPEEIRPSVTGWSVFAFDTLRPWPPEKLKPKRPERCGSIDSRLAGELLDFCTPRLGCLTSEKLQLARQELRRIVERGRGGTSLSAAE